MSGVFETAMVAMTGGGELLRSYGDLEAGGVGMQVFLLILFILINGFFVAAEFALVKVRSSQLDPAASEGKGGAKLAQHILGHLDAYLSACQLGITIASIVLGSVSEPFVSMLIQPVLSEFGMSDAWISSISFILGISVITFLHVVIGEQMPKVLAIRKALGTSMICSRPLHWFYLIFRWPIWILNACATWLLKVVFRMEPAGEHDISHTSEELRILVEQTGGAGEVTETEQEIVINALELNELTVRDIMTPRNEVICLDVEKTFDENLDVALETMHTRFPLVEGHLDNAVGLAHVKDLIREMRKSNPDLMNIRRDILPVPELMALDVLLKLFLEKQAHMALVVDEFGGSLGLVMLDDVLEELVGEINDEFDEEELEFRRINEDEFIADGTLSLHDLTEETGLEFDSAEVSTVGGYVTNLIGHLPEPGEKTMIQNYQATVTEADERSVGEVKFRRIEEEEPEPEPEPEEKSEDDA